MSSNVEPGTERQVSTWFIEQPSLNDGGSKEIVVASHDQN
jgi:hypothetical protein